MNYPSVKDLSVTKKTKIGMAIFGVASTVLTGVYGLALGGQIGDERTLSKVTKIYSSALADARTNDAADESAHKTLVAAQTQAAVYGAAAHRLLRIAVGFRASPQLGLLAGDVYKLEILVQDIPNGPLGLTLHTSPVTVTDYVTVTPHIRSQSSALAAHTQKLRAATTALNESVRKVTEDLATLSDGVPPTK